jgi:hypothetical protein
LKPSSAFSAPAFALTAMQILPPWTRDCAAISMQPV